MSLNFPISLAGKRGVFLNPDTLALSVPWAPVANSCCVVGIDAMSDGTLLGVEVGTGIIWTRASINDPWVRDPWARPWILDVAVMSDNTILGIGGDYRIWSRASLAHGWSMVSNSGFIQGFTVTQDDTIIGIGMSGDLWTRPTLYSPWTSVGNKGQNVTGITTMQDGSLLGVGTDNKLYTSATIGGSWVQAPDLGGAVKKVTVMPDGTIVGVALDNTLHVKKID